MATTSRRHGEDRVFVRDGRRHFRRRYSANELRIGAGILSALLVLILWVAWRGANPDPALFGDGADLLQPAEPVADRGPVPSGLPAPGWIEGKLSVFDASNLYVKINGREDYYKTFGFERLHFLSLVYEADPAVVVDIEFFDLGEAANALGAYAGERAPGATPDIGSGGMSHLDRNALFMTRGRYYVRAIGSEESPVVRAQLEALRTVFGEGIEGEELPWAYAFFVGGLGTDAGSVSYTAENAFSFGFARDVYSSLLEDGETEAFVVAAPDPAEAATLAEQFRRGFLEYGTQVDGSDGRSWAKDRYIDTIAGAASAGAWVVGVRGAPDIVSAEAALNRLQDAIGALAQPGAEN